MSIGLDTRVLDDPLVRTNLSSLFALLDDVQHFTNDFLMDIMQPGGVSLHDGEQKFERRCPRRQFIRTKIFRASAESTANDKTISMIYR